MSGSGIESGQEPEHSLAEVPSVLLSFDIEDREQLLGRKAGRPGWNRPTASFRRQMDVIFELLDRYDCRATHFMLGVTIEQNPEVVERAVARGDEIACHGYAHHRVHEQSRHEFARDLQRCVTRLEALTGRAPRGFRAPLFSVNRDTPWVFEVLADLGFHYDASLNDTPRVPRRFGAIPARPTRVQLSRGRSILTVPATCLRPVRGPVVPAGGGGYWRALPTGWSQYAVRRAVEEVGLAALYLHPYEFDPRPLEAIGPVGRRFHVRAHLKAGFDNLWRARVEATLRHVVSRYQTTTYEDGLAAYASRCEVSSHALVAGRFVASDSACGVAR